MNDASYHDTIQSLYIAYYGRPADYAGLQAWASALENAGGDVNQIIDSFANSPEAQDRFGGLSSEETVILLYNQLFNRDPESQEIIDAWVDQLENNPAVTTQSLALDLLKGAQNKDAQVIANRLEAANIFTERLCELEEAGTPAEYRGSIAATQAANWLLTVTADESSLSTPLNNLDYLLENVDQHAYLTVNDEQVSEDDGKVTLSLERSGGLYHVNAVAYGTSSGTADSSDYVAGSGWILFDFGQQSHNLSFTIKDDDEVEETETFSVAMTYIELEADNQNTSATVTISDNDVAVPAFFNLSDLDGTNGFILNGIDPFDLSGISVSGAGDVNNDAR